MATKVSILTALFFTLCIFPTYKWNDVANDSDSEPYDTETSTVLIDALDELFIYDIIDPSIFWENVDQLVLFDKSNDSHSLWQGGRNLVWELDEYENPHSSEPSDVIGKYLRFIEDGKDFKEVEYSCSCKDGRSVDVERKWIRTRYIPKVCQVIPRISYPRSSFEYEDAADEHLERNSQPCPSVQYSERFTPTQYLELRQAFLRGDYNVIGPPLLKKELFQDVNHPNYPKVTCQTRSKFSYDWSYTPYDSNMQCDCQSTGNVRLNRNKKKTSSLIIFSEFNEYESRSWIFDPNWSILTGETRPDEDGRLLFSRGLTYNHPLTRMEAAQYVIIHEYLHALNVDDENFMDEVLPELILLLRKKKALKPTSDVSPLLTLRTTETHLTKKEVLLQIESKQPLSPTLGY